MNEEKRSLKDAVLGLIKRRGAVMRPRWHFVLRSALIATGAVAAALALLFIASFIIFTLRVTGVWFVPAFGYPGVRAFLFSLPWILILVAGLFVVILEVLVKRYSFAYRQPLFYSALGIILLAALGGFAVARTPFHRGMFLRAGEHRLPVAEPLYREYGMRKIRHIHPGTVTTVLDNGFRMRNRGDEQFNVRVTPETSFPFGTGIAEGDDVVVFGERDRDEIRAFGIRRIDDPMFRGKPPHGMNRRGEPPMFRCGGPGPDAMFEQELPDPR